MLQQPSYNPDEVPNDFNPFKLLKESVGVQKFAHCKQTYQHAHHFLGRLREICIWLGLWVLYNDEKIWGTVGKLYTVIEVSKVLQYM